MSYIASVAQTSLEAYYSLPEDYLTERQLAVWRYIALHPDVTTEQVVVGMGAKSPNQIAPRITELLQMGAIERTGRAPTSSGRRAYTLRAKVVVQ